MRTVIRTDDEKVEPAFKGMIKKLMAENPRCKNIAMVFIVEGGSEIVFLRQGKKAKDKIVQIQARGGEAIGGYVYGERDVVPFALDTDPECPHFALVDRLTRETARGQN